MSSNRFFAFFGESRASVAMDIRDVSDRSSELVFALAFCNKRDPFEKHIARNILNGRLDAAQDPERNKPVSMTFRTVYCGSHPKRDVMNQVMDELRGLMKIRPHQDIRDVIDNIEVDLEQVAIKGLHETAISR